MNETSVSANELDKAAPYARPAGLPRWVLFIAAGMAVVLVAAASAAWLGMWFCDGDAAWLRWAAGASGPTEPGPEGVAVGWAAHPLASVVWWSAFRLFGWAYGMYQLCHALLWFAVLVVYGVMLRQLWGRRRRPALAATVIVAATLIGFSEQILHLNHVPLTCELLVGLSSVAMAAAGWRYRRWWLVALGWAPLAAAAAGNVFAAAYLLCLHLAAASGASRRRSLRPWVLLGAAGSAAVVVACAWWTGRPIPAWTPVGAIDRLAEFRESIMTGPAALVLAALAAVAGLVQGMRQQMRSWPMIAATGAVMALASLTIHPLLVVLVLTALTPTAWPFAVWALIQQAAVALDAAKWPEMQMAAMFAYVPVFVISIWRSPLAVWAARFGRRLDPTGRKLIYSAAALAAVLLAAHSGEWVQRETRVLRTLGERRRFHRQLLYQVTATVPSGGAVSVVTYADMGLSEQAVRQQPPVERAGNLISFTPSQYADLLAARGRDDLRVAPLKDLRTSGGWLLVTSRGELQAATNVLGSLGTPQMTLATDDIVSGLWRIQQRAPTPTPLPTTNPAAGTESSTQPAASSAP